MIRVMLINDYPLISSLVAASLENEPELMVVRSCTPQVDLIVALEESRAEVVLISGHFSVEIIMEFVKHVNKYEHLSLLLLGMENQYKDVLHYVETAASGYVVKSTSIKDLVVSIQSAAQKNAAVSPEVVQAFNGKIYKVAEQFTNIDAEALEKAPLTKREREVLELVAENLSNAMIAERLHLKESVVKNHVHSTLDKLGIKTRQDAKNYLAVLKKRRQE